LLRGLGSNEADAETRVTEVINATEQALDNARKSRRTPFLLVDGVFVRGAFAATLAAVEGGQLRDGTWNERQLIPRAT
jgi:hypothetical protein